MADDEGKSEGKGKGGEGEILRTLPSDPLSLQARM